MAGKKLRSIREYLYRNGRALDVARWNYHFEDGKVQDVFKTLVIYQNRDGSFAHGLDPVNQDVDSHLMATRTAVSVLREMDFPKGSELILQKIMSYLQNHRKAEDRRKETVLSSAEWIGLILRFKAISSAIYTQARRDLEQLISKVQQVNCLMKPQELSSLLNLYRDLRQVNKLDLLPADFEDFLKRRVDMAIERNESSYRSGPYVTPPSAYIVSKSDFAYKGNEKICDFYVRYLEETVTKDGYWDVRGLYELDISESALRDWRSKLIVDHMLFIERMVKEENLKLDKEQKCSEDILDGSDRL